MSSHTSTIYLGCTLPTYILDFSVCFFCGEILNTLSNWQQISSAFLGFRLSNLDLFLGFILTRLCIGFQYVGRK
jgi:hypothetical protein